MHNLLELITNYDNVRSWCLNFKYHYTWDMFFYLHFIYFLWIYDINYLYMIYIYVYIYIHVVCSNSLFNISPFNWSSKVKKEHLPLPLPLVEACQGAMESICELIGSRHSVERGSRSPKFPVAGPRNVPSWGGNKCSMMGTVDPRYITLGIQRPNGIWSQQEYYINKYLCWEIFGCQGVCRLLSYVCTGRLKRTSDDWAL